MTDSTAGTRLVAGNGLAASAHELLRAGPLTSDELARRVLALSGQPAVAARVVRTLLGDDPRFLVSSEGVRQLAAEPPEPAGRLRDHEWAVVDVETTGGAARRGHRVTEIAVVTVAGGEIRDRYATLVNPGRPIPAPISRVTGISDAMVTTAPRFDEVAEEVAGRLRGRIFVAHNAGFDWGFLHEEVRRATGLMPSGRTLCTVRIARRLLPHLPSRALGALAEHYGLHMQTRHRALDDADATARLLLIFLELLEEQMIADWAALAAYLRRRPRRRRRRTAMPRSVERV
ncbi:MAG: 3'-5' exonuclease [Longimicrobiaceae bacterium]